MSTTTLTFSFKVGGVLTDLSSVVLSDPTAAYGVRRTDTLGAVVAAGTAMTHQSTGVYTYSFTDPAEGLTYQWYVQWVNPSSVTQWSQFTATGGVAGTPAGLYGTYADLQSIYSPSNIALWPVDPNTNVPIPTLIQGAFNRADNYILQKLANQQFVPPVPPGTTAQQMMQCTSLGWIECELTGVYLYEANGLEDATKGMDGKMQGHRDNAEKQLRDLMHFNNAGFSRVSGYVDAPTFAAATVNPSGLPVDPSPPYPVPFWTGYRWVWGNIPGAGGCEQPGYGWGNGGI